MRFVASSRAIFSKKTFEVKSRDGEDGWLYMDYTAVGE
jgi:hypothetical protein